MRETIVRRARLLTAAAVLAGALTVALLRVTALTSAGGMRLSAEWAMGDFRTTVYYPVRDFLEGGNPYDKAEYSARFPRQDAFPPFLPSTLLLHAPFGMLPLVPSQWCYAAFSVACTLVLAWVALSVNGVTGAPPVLLTAGLILLSRPGQWSLLQGQVAPQAVIACYIALRYADRSPWVGGLGLAVSTFKPTFGIPLALLILARGHVRAVGAGVACALALNLPVVAILVHRSGGISAFADRVLATYAAWSGYGWTGHRGTESAVPGSDAIFRIDAIALGSRVAGRPLEGAEQLAITLVLLGAAAAVVRRLRAHASPQATHLSNAVTCATVLVSIYHFGYDLLLLVLPVVGVAYRRLPAPLQRGAARWGLLALVVVLAANYVSTQAVVERFRPGGPAWRVIASINPIALLMVFVVFVGVGVATAALTHPSPSRLHSPPT